MQSDAVKLTDAEKTRLLAEGVMGWTHSPETEITHSYWDGPRGFVHLTSCWQPLTTEAHAAEVREAMRAKGWNISQSYHPCGLNTTGIFMMPDGPLYHANKGSAAETLCHAALLALELAKEEDL